MATKSVTHLHSVQCYSQSLAPAPYLASRPASVYNRSVTHVTQSHPNPSQCLPLVRRAAAASKKLTHTHMLSTRAQASWGCDDAVSRRAGGPAARALGVEAAQPAAVDEHQDERL